MTDEEKLHWLEVRLQAIEFVHGFMGFVIDQMNDRDATAWHVAPSVLNSAYADARERYNKIAVELASGFPK